MGRATVLAALVAAFIGGVASARAADPYPSRVVRMVVPFPAGGTTDIFARVIGDKLAKGPGQQFVMDNCVVAGGNT